MSLRAVGRKRMKTPGTPSRLDSWLLEKCLGPRRRTRKLARWLRRKTLKNRNPDVTAEYFGERLVFPAKHDLVLLSNDLAHYNLPLRRLAQAIRARENTLRLLDIGANIGDGVPLVGYRPTDKYWLVEGSQTYLPYLRENTRKWSNVTVAETYLGETAKTIRGSEVVQDATAHIEVNGEAVIRFSTLDQIAAQLNVDPNLLKIDVEGHEPAVFTGGKTLISSTQPLIHMEWHPKMLLQEGFTVLQPLQILASLNYTRLIVYDNVGHLILEASLGDSPLLERLAEYARLRDLYYYDVVVSTPAHEALIQQFLQNERGFYKTAPSGKT